MREKRNNGHSTFVERFKKEYKSVREIAKKTIKDPKFNHLSKKEKKEFQKSVMYVFYVYKPIIHHHTREATKKAREIIKEFDK